MLEIRTVAAGIAACFLVLAACETTNTSVDGAGSATAKTAKHASASKIEAGDRLVGFRAGSRWTVFRQDSKEFTEWTKTRDLAKSVTRIGHGPAGSTLIGPDAETLDLFAKSSPGFVVQQINNRLWVLKEGSPALKDFLDKGAPDKRVTVMGGKGITMSMLSADRETIDQFVATSPKLDPAMLDGKIWLLR